jgi:hypothetical protein
MKFTTGSKTAGSVRRLEYKHTLATLGQVGRTDKSVVAGAYYD